ncbi:prepilin-type N-terminal cleavage/methylation domain-containing protein [Acetoanaerobium pronyense]|uniref:Prepilin-type N-terminal cleavage/methylation domain-containing protein n=1 Tax=Acetoanaerobium pronyense TaxID=1482736 RepID=A0ABS4KJB6_9FIRM|nr:type II secretion system protein [Acetoanaerobium pronyense]MBP2027845.1 prepilin-type N-terminal cleavage/methylation domain-containing protein [Acetoanaerobium pronyense]
MKKRLGFTLIEFLAVISLILLIAAISLPKYSEIVDNQRLKTDAATAIQLGKMAEMYYMENKNLPGFNPSKIEDYVKDSYNGDLKSKYIKDEKFKITLTDNKANVSLGSINFVVKGEFNESSIIPPNLGGD